MAEQPITETNMDLDEVDLLVCIRVIEGARQLRESFARRARGNTVADYILLALEAELIGTIESEMTHQTGEELWGIADIEAKALRLSAEALAGKYNLKWHIHAAIRENFRTYDVETLPDIPDSFVADHWHEDMCPRWESESLDLVLWIDFPNPLERELKRTGRFVLHPRISFLAAGVLLPNGMQEMVTDDWQAVLDQIEASKRKIQASS